MAEAGALPAIPIVDVREGGPVAHARLRAHAVRGLRDDCMTFFPRPLRPMLRPLDAAARRWLRRSAAPYVADIGAIAAQFKFPGIWFLNNSYQWGCTATAFERPAGPTIARTLDWPFAGLGRRTEIAHMRGAAGDFFSVTWPGYVGALTAMAPGRFAAAINQAPMWRRTLHPWLRPYDMAANAVRTWSIRLVPPDQLLRSVFESCTTFDATRERLETTPVARPVIFTLAGARAGEACVIERTEYACRTHTQEVCAANDWSVSRSGWEARIGGDMLFSCSFEGAADNSRQRRQALLERASAISPDGFEWVAPPVLNPFTRVGVVMCAAAGTMSVRGYEVADGDDLPSPATEVCNLAAPAALAA